MPYIALCNRAGRLLRRQSFVDAKDSQALAFYKKYGFIELPRIDRRLFLPMATVAQLFSEY